MKAMMTAMMTAAIKGCLFIFLPSACLQGLGIWALGFQGPEGLGRKGTAMRARGQAVSQDPPWASKW